MTIKNHLFDNQIFSSSIRATPSTNPDKLLLRATSTTTPDDFLRPLKHSWRAWAIYVDAPDINSHAADGSGTYLSPTMQCCNLAKEMYFF
jgi:hypothetical protein